MGSTATSPSPLVDFVAGTAGGVASLLVGQPFDTIKTRLQAQTTSNRSSTSSSNGRAARNASSPLLGHASDAANRCAMTTSTLQPSAAATAPRYYKSATDAFRIIVKEEKFLGLFKGVTSPMLGVAAMNACIFGSYGLALRFQTSPESSSHATLGHIMLAGCASGIASSFITSPIELLKIREQLDYSSKGAKPQTLQILKSIWKNENGLKGLYRGLRVTCLRDLGYGPYFLSYEIINRILLSLHDVNSVGPSPPQLSNLELALSGSIAGVLAWVSTFPIDCIKTRIQAQQGNKTGIMQATREIYRNGGFKAFWSGVGATVFRAIPVNATLFVVYEVTKDSLIQWGW
ncbi:unnamed protein product [Sympodiomycopsis kandeliae]